MQTLGHRPRNSSCYTQNSDNNLTGVRAVLRMEVVDGGGGGGGGTYLFTVSKKTHLFTNSL